MGFLDVLFPKKCINCDQWGGYVCDKCQVGLWEEEQICPVCARPSRYGLKHKYCHQANSLDGLTCLWAYEGIAKRIIQKAKYKFYFDLLRELSVNSNQLTVRPEFSYFLKFIATKPDVVPVPLHPDREKWRGFNQAAVIGRSLAARHSLAFSSHLLLRVRDTGHQTGRNREERLKAVGGAFSLAPRTYNLAPNMLLVDDVWTTGATLSECCRVLKKGLPAGRQVWGLVLAR